MILFPIINKGLVILIDIIGIWLAIIVYRNNPKARLNKILLWMLAAMFFWVNFAYFARLANQSHLDLASLFLKVAWFVTPILFTLLYFLVIYLLKDLDHLKTEKYQILNKVVIFIGGLSAFITGFTNFVIRGVKFTNGNLSIIYGLGMIPFLIAVSFLMGATLYFLIWGYFKLESKAKRKLQYFIMGILIFYILNIIFNILLPIVFNIVHLYWLGDYSAIFLLVFTVLAIIKRKLFDIKVILTSLLVALIAVLLVLDFFLFDVPLFLQVLKGIVIFAFVFFGYYLIKSVLQEIEYRKQLQKQYDHIKEQSIQIQKQSQEMQEQSKNIKALLRMKSDLLNTISHQLRTPTSIFRGMLDMIGRKGKQAMETKEREGFIQDALASADRLVVIIDSINEANELQGEEPLLDLKPVLIQDIIKDSMNIFKRTAKEKKINLEFIEPKQKIPKIFLDTEWIKSVLEKLIDNAVWYTPKDQNGKIEISAKHNPEDKTVSIKIKDNGIGLTEEDKKILFTQFGRGRGSKIMNVNSSGLGLYIVKRIAEAHKGRIEVYSKGEDKGSIFILTLPVMQEV